MRNAAVPPEQWCDQHGMLIDRPDNRTAPKGLLGASRPVGQCPPLLELVLLTVKRLKVLLGRKKWAGSIKHVVMFSVKYLMGGAKYRWKGLCYITDELHLQPRNHSWKHAILLKSDNKSLSFLFSKKKREKLIICSKLLWWATVKVSQLLHK